MYCFAQPLLEHPPGSIHTTLCGDLVAVELLYNPISICIVSKHRGHYQITYIYISVPYHILPTITPAMNYLKISEQMHM